MIMKQPVTGIVLSADFETMEIRIRMRHAFDFKPVAPGHKAVVLSREEYERLTTKEPTGVKSGDRSVTE